MSARRKIAVVTGTRAEYGLLSYLLKNLAADPSIDLQLIVTGTHLMTGFGHTIDLIKADGFDIAAEVPMDLQGDTDVDMAHAMASVLSGMTNALAKLRPEIVVVLGDRFESLALAQACLCLKIPLAHIHGGELTQGNIDESIRHAITKMAQIHFVAAHPFKQRVLQLGENPHNVHVVGAVGLEAFFTENFPTREALEKDLGITFNDTSFMATYHPVTLDKGDPTDKARDFCAALDQFPEATIIISGANADAGGQRMNKIYEDYAAMHPGRVVFRKSLGHLNYLGVLKTVTAVVGNSSSGLLEAPSAGVPTVNIGDRQKGRLSPMSVIHCADDTASIVGAMRQALSSEARAKAAKKENPYFASEHPSRAIADILKSVNLDGIIRKPFYDL
ncbi:MAG TPA: UDP-N-acetylglucosamine 2-epimerase [Alphaproteobacteria bacterium]